VGAHEGSLYNPNHESFPNYGGRGITVCGRWRSSFVNFLADMGATPPGKTLDQWPHKNGNYEPGNVRWATPKEQGRNRRSTKLDESTVALIRSRLLKGIAASKIADEFAVTRTNIVHIKNRKIWT
jgi:hypothetical protein